MLFAVPAPMAKELQPALMTMMPETFLNTCGTQNQSSDELRMYKFKVVICMRDPGHDWTRCPFAHRGERARRRHPSLYCGETCVNYKKGYCKNGLTCEFAHGWFESWLHPHRYRTKHCKHGVNCNRRVCSFAHGDEEIRFPPTLSSSKMKDHKNYSSTHNRSLSTNVVTPQIYNATRQDVVSSPRGVHAAQMLLKPLYMNSPLQYNTLEILLRFVETWTPQVVPI